MNRIEQFFYTNNEPYISSYNTDILSSVVRTIGAEYPFVPDVLPKFKNQIYFAAINSSDKSIDCNSLFDEVAKSLEFSLHSINIEEYNAWSGYWASSWDIFWGFCLDMLTFLPSFQGIIESLMAVFAVLIGVYTLTAETVNELYNKVKEIFEEYQRELLKEGNPNASSNSYVMTPEYQRLEAEFLEKMQKIQRLGLEQTKAMDELAFESLNLIRLRTELTHTTDLSARAKIQLFIEQTEGKIIKLKNKVKELEALYASLMKRLKEIQDLKEVLQRQGGDLFRNSSRMGQYYQIAKNRLSGIWYEIETILRANPENDFEQMTRLGLRNPLKQLFAVIYSAFYTLLGGFARAISKTATVVGKYIPLFIFAYIVYFFYDLFDKYTRPCKDLTESIKGFTVKRQNEVNEYYDELEKLISAGCCDKPSCPVTDPAKPPECMKDDGTCDNDGSGSGCLGSVGVRLLGIKTIQKFKHCGYKPDCIPKPDCTKWNGQYPGGVDNQPNYSTSTWPSQPYGAGGVAAIDSRGVFSPPVIMPKPRPASFPTGPGQSNRACGWVEEELPDCITWETIETAIKNAGNAILVNIGNGITDVLDGIRQTLPDGDDLLESAFP